MDKPLTDKMYKLEKIPGKGGWTYAALDEIAPDKNAPFGWRRVKGTIDDYEISAYNLMPMGNGRLFLPVKAEIRKKIGKQEGDTVHIVLYRDDQPTEIPEELIWCMEEEPGTLEMFNHCTDSEKRYFTDWIYAAKNEDTKAGRILKMLDLLKKGRTLYDQPIRIKNKR